MPLDFIDLQYKAGGRLDIIAIKQDIEDLLGREVDIVTENSLSPYFREEVLKQAVKFVKRDQVYLQHILEAIHRIECKPGLELRIYLFFSRICRHG